MRLAAGIVALVSITASVEAAVLCARQKADGTFNASVKIRETCRPKETQLDPAALSLQGPPGPQGEPGVCACSTTTTTTVTTTTIPPGTAVDPSTGLMWELKVEADGVPNLASPHDADNRYRWCADGSPVDDACDDPSNQPNGDAFAVFLTALNTPPCFAGVCDWRVPTLAGLQTIVDLSRPGCGSGAAPCFDQLVDPTVPCFYWSSASYDADPTFAWAVGSGAGNAAPGYKPRPDNLVRAVRGSH